MNMGFLPHPHGDHRISGFEDSSDFVNAVADRSIGFVWRLKEEGCDLPENDTGRLFGRPEVALAMLSVWESFKGFSNFAHKTVHGQFVNRRADWFEHADAPSYGIWPVDEYHIPTLSEGKQKLLLLQQNGPSRSAYDFAYGERTSGA